MLLRKSDFGSDSTKLENFLDNLAQNYSPTAIKDNPIKGAGTPSNILAEQILIGSVLLNNEMLDHVDFLQAEHFYEPIHQKIFQAVLALLESGISATHASLQSMLHNDNQFRELGESYLMRITSLAITVVNVAEYGKIIYDLALRRKLIIIGQKLIESACNSGLDYTAVQQIEHTESQLFNLAVQGIKSEEFVSIKDCVVSSLNVIGESMKHPHGVSGISTGFRDLDHILSGLHNSDLLIIAGRPGMGKTTFALNLAVNAAKSLASNAQNSKDKDNALPAIGIFSLEMPSEQLVRKLLSMQSKVEGKMLVSGSINEERYNLLKKASKEINNWPIFIDDTPALTITAIRTRARRLKRKHNLGALFIDYLQLLQGTKRIDNRVQEISEITQGLKALAKELNIPVIALSQLSRAVEQRVDKRPMLSDLRESGSIEQDADIVLFVYRDEYYIKGQKPQEGTKEYNDWFEDISKVHNKAEIIIAKHRNGSTGNVALYYDGSHSLFADYSPISE